MNYSPVLIVSLGDSWPTRCSPRRGVADNGLEYIIKSRSPVREAPAAEFLCYSLANLCGVVTPRFDIVRTQDELAFGSAAENALTDPDDVWRVLRTQESHSTAKVLSRIFVFDVFVHNVGRHVSNYLSVPLSSGYAIKAIDFDKALTAHGMPPAELMPPATHTLIVAKLLLATRRLDVTAGHEVLNALERIPIASFGELVRSLPRDWLEQSARDRIVQWWKRERSRRIGLMRKSLESVFAWSHDSASRARVA